MVGMAVICQINQVSFQFPTEKEKTTYVLFSQNYGYLTFSLTTDNYMHTFFEVFENPKRPLLSFGRHCAHFASLLTTTLHALCCGCDLVTVFVKYYDELICK